MSIETYELITGKLELYSLLNDGLTQVEQHKTKSMKEALVSIRSKLNK